MSAVEEELRAALWQTEQEAIVAKRAYAQSLLAGDPAAALVFYSKWQAFQLSVQEARDNGEQVLTFGYEHTR